MSTVRRVGIHEAKTHFSGILREVEEGGEIVVMRSGRPIARIVSESSVGSVADSYGMFEGQFQIGEDFDADSEHLADLFGVAGGPPAKRDAADAKAPPAR